MVEDNTPPENTLSVGHNFSLPETDGSDNLKVT